MKDKQDKLKMMVLMLEDKQDKLKMMEPMLEDKRLPRQRKGRKGH